MRPLAKRKAQREPTIALINIVFLMLVFFMVAGTLAQPLDQELKLIETQDLEGRALPDALVVHPDGRLTHAAQGIASAADFVASLDEEARAAVRLLPDRALPAKALVRLTRDLRAAGAGRVLLVTQRALQ